MDRMYVGNITLVKSGEGVVITRPNILGRMSVHIINSIYSIESIASYLRAQVEDRRSVPFIQQVFPHMRVEDREFLLTGLSPKEWAEIFPEGEEE